MKLLLCSQEKKNGSFFFFPGKMSDKPKQKYRVIKFLNDVREKNRESVPGFKGTEFLFLSILESKAKLGRKRKHYPFEAAKIKGENRCSFHTGDWQLTASLGMDGWMEES